MPLPPSSTTFSGAMRPASMYSSAAARNGSPTSSVLHAPRRSGGRARARPAATRSRSSPMPESPESASAPLRTSFAPVYAFGLCEAVHMSPPSSSREPTVQ